MLNRISEKIIGNGLGLATQAELDAEAALRVSDVAAIRAENTQRGINVMYPPAPLVAPVANGTTDDTLAIQNIINSLASGKTTTLIFVDVTIRLNTAITFPSGINLLGRNATLINNASIVFSGNNEVNGIIFNANMSTNLNGVQLSGSNIVVRNCTFTNFKPNVSNNMMTLKINTTADNILVEHCTFDGIYPYDDTLTGGSNGAVARAIYSSSTGSVIIRNNVFKNMHGYTDGDFIHLYTAEIADTTFPFNQNINVRYAYTHTIIEGNIFYQDCKSSIKIMASGVQINNNMIYSTYSSTSNLWNAVIRVYGSEDSIVQGNKITINSSLMQYSLELSSSARCRLINNKITMQVAAQTGLTYPMNNIHTQYTLDCEVSDNYMLLRNANSMFYSDGNQNLKISKNKIKNYATTTSQILVYRCYNASVNDINTTFTKNEIDDNNTKAIFQLSVVQGFYCTFNFMKNANIQFTIASTDVLIEGNIVTAAASLEQFVIVQVGGATVKIYRNDIYGSTKSIVKISGTTTTSIRVLDNILDVDAATASYIFDTSTASGQDMTQLTYKSAKGCIPIKYADYGATADRPTWNKDNFYPYFDTTLGKPIWWLTSAWKDATGTAV